MTDNADIRAGDRDRDRVADGVVLRLVGTSRGDIWVKYRHRHV